MNGNFEIDWENVETKIDGSAKLVSERVTALAMDLGKNRLSLTIMDESEGGVFTFLQKMGTDLKWSVIVRSGSYRLRFEGTEIDTHTVDLGSRCPQTQFGSGITFNPGPVEHKLVLKFKTWCKL